VSFDILPQRDEEVVSFRVLVNSPELAAPQYSSREVSATDLKKLVLVGFTTSL